MRDQFPIFKAHPDLIYFDTAATAQKPKVVLDALRKFYEEDYATVHRAIYSHATQATEGYNLSRETAAKFLNASFEEILFTKGTTDGINLVARSFAKKFLKEGDEILVSEMEHHSNLVPWQMIAEEMHLTLRWIPVNLDGTLAWENAITDKTRLVAVTHVSNVLGTINPIREIIKKAHLMGAVVLVDGAQAAPHLKIDVQELDADFYAFSSHKCYGPTGVGVLYGKKKFLDEMDPLQGGGDMIEEVTYAKTTFQKPPLRFEAGTPNIASVIGLKAALEFVLTYQGFEKELTPYAEKGLRSIPNLKILGNAPLRGSLFSFTIEGVHPLDLATLLDLKQIAVRSGHMCAEPLLHKFGLSSALRVSFGVYNSKKEIDFFIDQLESSLKLC